MPHWGAADSATRRGQAYGLCHAALPPNAGTHHTLQAEAYGEGGLPPTRRAHGLFLCTPTHMLSCTVLSYGLFRGTIT